ncbi:MAG: alpha/beta fold hydrolase [Pirellulaceae bacterium]
MLDSTYETSPDEAIQTLGTYAAQQPTLEMIHSVAELAFLQADWAARLGRNDRAQLMYATALISSHQFLFDSNLDVNRNAFDPQFRSISDIYNRSLEEILRRMIKRNELTPNTIVEVEALNKKLRFQIANASKWQYEEIERFEIASDYEPQGVNNHYRTYGLGVPLIGVRKPRANDATIEEHYPPDLTMAFTAFLDCSGTWNKNLVTAADTATLVLFDPLQQNVVQLGDRVVPLESDITTPMAYHMNDPLLSTNVMATFGLLNANFAKEFQGIYMLEPYDPDKIPVVMVHGLWSSPVTWLQMFNDLRADHDLQDKYQFWFCLYPTGQPFWESARQVRNDLEQLRNELSARYPSENGELPVAATDMVLVGHSMGGLVSRMLTVHSRGEFWSLISEYPVESFDGDPATLARLKNTFEFEPVAGVSEVITIGTPFKGSPFASDTVKWLGEKIITLPKVMTNDYSAIAKENKELVRNEKLLATATSLDSLAPNNPIFNSLMIASAADGVHYHNIAGHLEKQTMLAKLTKLPEGDGVVAITSSQAPFAVSSIEVDEEHSLLHQHPATIMEVKRVLLEHLKSLEPEFTPLAELPTGPLTPIIR